MCKVKKLIKFTIKKSAQNPTEMRHKLAAIITKGSWIIAVGYNRWKSFDHSIHAEQDAINKALKLLDNLEGCELYIARWCKTQVGLSKPCNKCMIQIHSQGIDRVYYTTPSSHKKLAYQKIDL